MSDQAASVGHWPASDRLDLPLVAIDDPESSINHELHLAQLLQLPLDDLSLPNERLTVPRKAALAGSELTDGSDRNEHLREQRLCLEHFADLGERQVEQTLQLPDQHDALDVTAGVEAASASPSPGRLKQPTLLVVADRALRDACATGDFTDLVALVVLRGFGGVAYRRVSGWSWDGEIQAITVEQRQDAT